MLISQLINDFNAKPDVCISSKLRMGINHLKVSLDIRSVKHFLFILSQEEQIPSGFISSFIQSDFYQIYRYILPLIKTDDSYLEIILSRMVNDEQLDLRMDMIEFINKNAYLETNEHILPILCIKKPVTVFEILHQLNALQILNKIPLDSILEFLNDAILLEGLQIVLGALNLENALSSIEIILSHSSPGIIFELLIKLKRMADIDKILMLFSSQKFDNIQKISKICHHIAKIEIESIEALLSKHNLPDILESLLLLQDHTTILIKIFHKIHDIEYSHIEAIAQLHAGHLLNDENIHFILHYVNPFSINGITESMMHSNKLLEPQDFSKYFAYYENMQALKELSLRMSIVNMASVPEPFQKHMKQIMQDTQISHSDLLNFGLQLLLFQNELPVYLEIFCKTHFIQCLKHLQHCIIEHPELLKYVLSSENYDLPQQLKQLQISNPEGLPAKTGLGSSPFFLELIKGISGYTLSEQKAQVLFEMHLSNMLNPDLIQLLMEMSPSTNLMSIKKNLFLAFLKTQSRIKNATFLFVVNCEASTIIYSSEYLIPRKKFLDNLSKHPHISLLVDIFQMTWNILSNDIACNTLLALLHHRNIPILHTILHSLSISQYGELLFLLEYSNPQIILKYATNSNIEFQKLILDCRKEELYLNFRKKIGTQSLYDFVCQNTLNQRSTLIYWLKFCLKKQLLTPYNLESILNVFSCKDTLYAIEKIVSTTLFINQPLLSIEPIIQSHHPLLMSDLHQTFSLYSDIFDASKLILWSKHDNLKAFHKLIMLKSSIRRTINRKAYLANLVNLLDYQEIEILLKIFENLQFNLDTNGIEDFISKIFAHTRVDVILKLSQSKLIQDVFLNPNKMTLLLAIMDSSDFEALSSIVFILHQNNFDVEIILSFLQKCMKKNQDINAMSKLLPYALKESNDDQLLNQLLESKLADLEDFFAHYNLLSLAIIEQMNNKFFNYQDSKERIEILIKRGYVLSNDHKTQIQLILVHQKIELLHLIEKWEKYKLFETHEKIAVVKMVAFHPRVSEIDCILNREMSFKLPEIYKTLYLETLKSNYPFDVSFFCDLLFDANLIEHIEVSKLRNFFKNEHDLDKTARHLSNHMDYYKNISADIALLLLTYIYKSSAPQKFLRMFQTMNKFERRMSHQEILQFIRYIDNEEKLNEFQYLLNIFSEYEYYNFSLLNDLKNKPTIWLKTIINCIELLEQNKLMNVENIRRLLNSPHPRYRSLYITNLALFIQFNQDLLDKLFLEEYPKEISIFIHTAIQLNIFKMDFYQELLTYKTILFASPAVSQQFLNIPQSHFLSINLYQLINLAKAYEHDFQQASEALLKYCFALSIDLDNNQITHLKSVHLSSSESAARLWNRYHEKISEITVIYHSLITFLKKYIPSSELVITFRCIESFQTSDFGHYIDPESKISLKMLLALCTIAMQDDSIIENTLIEDRVKALHHAILDIQRGYNVVDSEADLQICSGGAFNKLIEAFTGIHQDFQQILITPKLASAKFNKLVINYTKDFLIQASSPYYAMESNEKQAILEQLLTDGVSCILNYILPLFIDEFFEEYHAIFTSQEDPLWLIFKESAIYVDIFHIHPLIRSNLSELTEQKSVFSP